MKKIFILLILNYSLSALCQTKINNSIKLNCDSIRKGLFDKSIYSNINGKYLMQLKGKKEIYLIKVLNYGKYYYVSEAVMKQIKDCNCEDVKIETPIDQKNKKAPKIVRE